MDWTTVLAAGIVGGAAMEVSAVLLSLTGLKRSSMVAYEGCMLTGRPSGAGSYIAGLVMHLGLSILIAFIYAWAFQSVWGRSSWIIGLLTALPHWLIGGLVVPLFDRFSQCVKRGIVQPLGIFAASTWTSFFTFLIGHLAYGATIGMILGLT